MALGRLASLLVPLRCAGCGNPGAGWCGACEAALVGLEGPRCGRCGAPARWPVERCRECSGRRLAFSAAWAAVAHEGSARALLHRWKAGGIDLAAVASAAIIARRAAPEADGICAVPCDPGRRRMRGVDGPAAMAARLAGAWELPVLGAEVLARTSRSRSRPQRGLDAAARARNLNGAFRSRLAPRRVVLIDDVYTTGATAHACSAALRKAGAERVEVVTFARAIRR